MSIKQRIKQYVAEAFAKSSPEAQPKTETAPVATEGAITQEVQEAIIAAIAEEAEPLRTQLTKAQEDLAVSQKEVTSLQGQVSEKDGQISKLQGELKTAQEKAAAAEKQTNETKAGVKTEVAKGVATVAAEQGLPAALPIKTAAQNPANPEIKTELKGLAKVTAAIKAEISKK